MNLFWGLKENRGTSLSKKMTGVLQLVNETALLLDRTAIKDRYEGSLGVLRAKLLRTPANPVILGEVSAGLTELRRQMRLAGYDLSMGKYALVFDGFRHDDSITDTVNELDYAKVDMLKLLTDITRPMIVFLNPDCVVLYGDQLPPDTAEQLRKRLLESIPREFLPRIVLIPDILDDFLDGLIHLALKTMEPKIALDY
jgi:hypothetical protein